MSRNRLEIIWRFLHFNDNTARPANDTDRLYKVHPVLDHLVSKFREMYQPNDKWKSWISQEQAGGGEERVDPPTESNTRAPYNTDPRNRVNYLFAVHALVPIASTSKKQHPTRRCRVCACNGFRSETSFYCKSCGVPLHSGNCCTVYRSKIK